MPNRPLPGADWLRARLATEEASSTSPFDSWDDPELVAVWRVLNRTTAIQALQELLDGLDRGRDRQPAADDPRPIAFGFDTNAIFKLGLGKHGPDAIDYLRTQHTGPILVPGQAVQEVWNNLLAAVQPKGKSLLQSFRDFKNKAAAIDLPHGESERAFEDALVAMSEEYEEWLDPKSQEVLGDTLEVLGKGNCCYVPRAEFLDLARARHETKTPPGFRDTAQNHGDFFVWADFLYGLAQSDLSGVKAIVLVTNDEKPDWSRAGVAHPVLTAEARAIGGAPFSLWTTKQFFNFVSQGSH